MNSVRLACILGSVLLSTSFPVLALDVIKLKKNAEKVYVLKDVAKSAEFAEGAVFLYSDPVRNMLVSYVVWCNTLKHSDYTDSCAELTKIGMDGDRIMRDDDYRTRLQNILNEETIETTDMLDEENAQAALNLIKAAIKIKKELK